MGALSQVLDHVRMLILSNYVLLASIDAINVTTILKSSEVYMMFQFWGHGLYGSGLKGTRKLYFGTCVVI